MVEDNVAMDKSLPVKNTFHFYKKMGSPPMLYKRPVVRGVYAVIKEDCISGELMSYDWKPKRTRYRRLNHVYFNQKINVVRLEMLSMNL